MTATGPKSLKRRLIGRLALAQGVLIVVLIAINSAVVSVLWIDGALGAGYARTVAQAVGDAVARRPDGALVLRPTERIRELRDGIHGLWFVAQDAQGRVLSEGPVPPSLAPLLPQLATVKSANLSDARGEPLGVIDDFETGVGPLRVMADARGFVSLRTVGSVIVTTMSIAVFLAFLMAIATFLVTPLVVRRALRGLETLARDAATIDIRRTGVRLSEDNVPSEITPMVSAFNAALSRIDEGHERHRVFLADAAHELRTPIAIITARIAALRVGDERDRLMADSARLNVLAGQLLDLGRLDGTDHDFQPVDVAAVAERVVDDLAPLAFAAGYEVSYSKEENNILVNGDEAAIERAVSNLMQNAIDHGGHSGMIAMHVDRQGTIEVCDDGGGVAPEHREVVFGPFHRLDRNSRGAGLGLNLVRRIMRLHGGDAIVTESASGGACFRLTFTTRE